MRLRPFKGWTVLLLAGAAANVFAASTPDAAPYSNVTATQVQANWTESDSGDTFNAILSTDPSPSTNGDSGNINQTTTDTSFTFTGLAVNTLYYVDVQAVGSAFAALGSVSTLATMPAPAPATTIQTNEFTVNWAPNGNPLGTTYTAELSTDPGFGSITASSSTVNTSLLFAGLTPNTTYYSHVEAINQNGVATAFISLPTVFTLTNAPGPNAFTNITASQVQANWTANGNPAGTQYTVILSTGASPSTNGLSGNTSFVTTDIFALFTGLVVNTAYYADVKAEGSVFTTLGSAPTLANVPTPDNPTNIGVHQLTANWEANGNPAGTAYLVQASTDVAFGSIAASVSVTVSSANVTGLSPNTAYFMRVQALNQMGIATNFVALPSATTLEDIPNAPGIAPFTNVTVSQLQANWTANGNPPDASYTAILSTMPSPATNNVPGNQSTTVSATAAVFSGLSPNQLYFVDVLVTTSGGSSAPTSLGSMATLANPPAQASPSAVSANQITANWGANGNPSGTTYVVQASTDSAFGSIATAVTTTASSATLTGLLANTLYFMQVQAINQNSVSTSFTALPNTTTLEPSPNAPVPAAFSNVTAAQLQANWTANGNLSDTSYTAILSTEASPSTNGLSSNQSVTTSNMSTIFPGLLPNILYFVDVKATSTGGSSAWSSLGSIATLANPPTPSAPSAIGINQITANWGTNGNSVGTTYVIQASTDPAFGSIAVAVTTTASSATLTGLLSNTAYFMQVQATNQNNVATSFTSLPSAVTVQDIPNAPGVAAFSNVTAIQVRANWTTNGNPSNVTYTAILSSAASPSTNGLAGNQTVTNSTTSATFTGLFPNVLYFVDVNATSTGGSSPYSSLGSIPTRAAPPIAAAPSNIQPNQITANWTAHGNPPDTSYLVQASLDPTFTTITVQVSTTSLSAPLPGLAPQTLYSMRVQAKNQAGQSTAFVPLPSATTLSNPPNVPGPAGFTAVAANQLQANWTANGNGADATYTIILSSASSPSTNGLAGNQSVVTSSTSATFVGLAPNTLYFAQVKATNGGGDSAYATLGSIPTLANSPTPDNPTNIQTNQITANWETNGNPTGTQYLVQASADAGFASIASAKTTVASSATLNGLLANTVYFMRIQATNQSGFSTSFVALPSATTLTNAPTAPGNAGFGAVSTSQLQANWTANGNPVGTNYTAILSSAPSPSTNNLAGNQTVTNSSTSVVFSGLSPNTLYYVQVNASNAGGSSAFTDLGSIPTLANSPIAGNPSDIGANQVTAQWGTNNNPLGTSYLVQASPDSGFATITSGKTTIASSATLTGLLAATTYFMRVQAINQSGLATSFTLLPSAVTLNNPPGPPGGAGFSGVSTNQLQANWIANGNPAGTTYLAILSTAPSPSTNGLAGNQSNSTTNTSTTFSNLSPNTLYYVEVNATNGATSSAYTSLGSVPTLANTPGSANPTSIQTNQVTANWVTNGNPPETAYLVQVSPDPAFGTITSAKTTTASSATLNGLLATTQYFFQVEAINQSGLTTPFTALPSATTLGNPPSAPGGAGFSAVTVTQLQANWTANGNPAGTTYTAILSSAPSPSTNGLAGNSSNATTNTSATFANLSPNTLYYVDVNASNQGSGSAYTSLGSVPTLANQPTPANPTDIETNQITANWGTNGNPAGTQYLVQTSADPGFSTITSAKTTVDSSATLNGLLPNTPYFFQVQAINQGGLVTTFTPLPGASTLTSPPTVPGAAGFNNVTITQLQANWTANGNSAGTTYTAILSIAPSPSTNGLADNQTITTTLSTATFSGLLPNTVYYVQVNASNAGGNSAFADLGSVPTLASPPTSADPTAVGTNQITANWGTGSNPPGTSYLVQASPDSGFVTIASVKTTVDSSATLNGLLPTTLYFMRVEAFNQSGLATVFTFLPSTTTLQNAPAVPAGAGFSNITIVQLQANWTANGNVDGTNYTAILSSAPSPSTNALPGNQSVTTTGTAAIFSGLSPNTLYYVQVKASNAGGDSAFSDLGSAATLANAPSAAAPTGITGSQITANWIANGNPDGTIYRAQASVDSGFAFISVGIATTSLSATFSGLTPQTTYYMRVQAVNFSGAGTSFTPLATVVTLGNPPVSPGAATFSNVTPTQLQANWTQNGNPAGTSYQVVLSTAPSPSTNGLTGNQTLSGTGTFAIFTGLSPNTIYYADVNASNLNGASVFTSLGQETTLANAPTPADPTTVGANQLTANWGANGNPPNTSYLVQAGLDSGFTTIAAANTSTGTASVLIGLTPSTTYFLRVQAINQSFVGTAFVILPGTTTLANAPAIPGPLSFTAITTNQIQANWTPNGNPAGTSYVVVFSTDSSPSTNGISTNQTVTTQATSVVFTALIPNTAYFADVKASNISGLSAVTSLGSADTLANAPLPTAPTNVGKNQITANWTANGNPSDTLYLVQASLAADFSSLIAANVTVLNSFTFGGLSSDTTYYMQVQAINRGGQATAFTVLPPAETVITAPGTTGLTAALITDSAITWTWFSVPNATGYRIVTENGVNVSGDLPSGTLQWQETGLAVNTGYSRSLVAINASGISTSTLVTAYTLAHQPTNLIVQDIESNSITIGWNANGNPLATQYVAQVSQGPGTARTITVTGVQATFDTLAGATTYFFTVQAVNGAGTAAAAGNSLTATTLPQLATFGQICSPQPSTLAFNGPKGPVRVDIPSGAFAGCIQMTVKIPGAFPTAPSSGTPLRGTGVGLELDVNVSVQPSVPLTLDVPFTNADVPATDRSQLVLARYDPVHNLWIMLHSSVDPTQNVVSGQTDHLSLYQVMVAIPSANLSAINVYPNPFRPSLGHTGVNFTNLPVDADIELYTLTGEKIQSLTASSTGAAFWDGRNQSGQPAASGIYFAVIKSGDAKSIVKVAVER